MRWREWLAMTMGLAALTHPTLAMIALPPYFLHGTILWMQGLVEKIMDEGRSVSELHRKLARNIEITRRTRYAAHTRLMRRKRATSLVISLFSIYLIALSLLPNIIELSKFQSQLLLSSSIIFSVFVLITSLIDGDQDFSSNAHSLRKCAQELSVRPRTS